MPRVGNDTLSLHLEVALSTAAPSLLEGLAGSDRRQRHAAASEITRQLVERLRCFAIFDDDVRDPAAQPSLFPPDMGPMDTGQAA